MATGGNFTRSCNGSTDNDHENQQNASAEEDSTIIKYPCNPCRSREDLRMTEAQHYCSTCEEFYCKECERFHRSMSATKDHIVYGKSDMDRWGQKATSSNLREKCVQHPTETITMVCLRCNELRCHVCISIKHCNCDRKEYIPTAANGILMSSRRQNIINSLQKCCSKASVLKDKLNNSLEVLNSKQTTFLDQINDMRRQADNIFNEMERRVTSLGNTLHRSISEDIDMCNNLRLEMNSVKEKLQNIDNADESHVFMEIVRAENRNSLAKTDIDKAIKNNGRMISVEEFNSTPDSDFSQVLYQRKVIGQVSCRFPFTRIGLHRDCVHKESHLDGNVEGICQIHDCTFILIDSANFCLEWLSSSYKLKCTVDLPEAPSAICNTESKHIAVSLNSKLCVFMVDENITRVQSQDLTFSHRCCGLAYFNKKYYISDNAFTVYMYNTNGVCQKEIETYARGPLFQSVRNLAINKVAKTIYVTDLEKGLITMDLAGNVLSTIETNDTKGAYGVCVTSTGNVLVTNYLLDKVIEVDEYGTTVLQTKFISLPKGLSSRAICSDTQNTNILVSENPLEGSGMLTVFS